MIALFLLSGLAFHTSAADEASFARYRTCVEQKAGAAELASTDIEILGAAKTACELQKDNALAALVVADLASAASGTEAKVPAKYRMEFMDIELTADVIARLVTRRAAK